MGGSVPDLLEDTAHLARGPLPVGTVLRLRRFGKPPQCHFLLQVMTSVPDWAADACSDLPFPASWWMTPSSARGTSRSAPVPGLCLPAVLSHYHHCVHCPQPPPLIDLGPGPVSNCFLQIGFTLDCWVSVEQFLPCTLCSSFPSLINFLRGRRICGLTHISSCRGHMSCNNLQIKSPTWTSRVHLEEKKNPEDSSTFSTSFLPGHICVNVLYLPLLLFNWVLLRRHGRMKNSACHLVFEIS